MGVWAKSLQIFNCLCDNGKQSVRQIAQKTGFSKSSVHRLQQARERRDTYPESWWWETADGRCWLIRLVVATLYTFGLTRGVGAETISEFFGRLRLETHVGCSPSALRGVMQALEHVLLETAEAWEHEGIAAGEVRPIIGAVDETFLERMMLVFMDLVSGYLLFEEVAEDRSYDTWYALVEARLEALGAGVLSLVSDRAKALMKLAETGLACLSIPDLFHLIQELVKSYSLSICGRLRQARQALSQAQEHLRTCQASHPSGADVQQAQAVVDLWWQGVWQDMQQVTLTPMWTRWIEEVLLPLMYWQQQVSRTRCPRRKARLFQALEAVQDAFDRHPITRQLAPDVLEGWQAWAAGQAKAFQRASSAVEGRNGYLSQMHHNHRGLPKRRYKVWTVLHNFDCRASDGTTPASRFFRRGFPDLF